MFTMFGTLVSADVDQGTLKFVENRDPEAAVSRNLRDKIHISCTFCRSRKIRCSGDRDRCQRCASMGLDCVYPEHRRRNKRQEKEIFRQEGHGGAVQQSSTEQNASGLQTPMASTDSEQDSGDLTLDPLNDMIFDDEGVTETLFGAWTDEIPAQHGADRALTSSGSCGSTAPSSTTGPAPHETSSIPRVHSMARVNQDSHQAPENRGYDAWEELSQDDATWAVDMQKARTASESLSPDSWTSTRQGSSSSCRCLISLISFLERLLSRSSCQETRIDMLLSEVRNSIETLGKFLSCQRCARQQEHSMLLAMSARQISIVCSRTASCYKTLQASGTGESSPNPKEGHVNISISTYHVNRRERLHVLKSLVAYQLIEMQQQIERIKSRYSSRPSQEQDEALLEAQEKIRMAQGAISGPA